MNTGNNALGKKTRFEVLDIMKGFGMLFLMMWHSFSPLAHYFGIFFLAMFLMVSGFTWNEKPTQTWHNTWELIKKRFKALMVPYFVYSIIFLLLTNVFVKLNLYPADLSREILGPDGYLGIEGFFLGLLFVSLGLMGSVFMVTLWYFYQLFLVYVLHAVVCSIFRKWIERRRLIFYLVLIAVVLLLMQFFNSLDGEKFKVVKVLSIRFLSCYVAFIMGVPARMIYNKLNISSIHPVQVVLFVITAGLIYVMNTFTAVDLGAGNITSVWSYAVCGILGFIFTFCLSNMLDNCKYTKKFANTMSYIGQNTKPIMIYHLIFFKPVALIYILICGLSFDSLRQFPIVMDENYKLMWIFYSISGLTLSLLMDKLMKMLKEFIAKWKK